MDLGELLNIFNTVDCLSRGFTYLVFGCHLQDLHQIPGSSAALESSEPLLAVQPVEQLVASEPCSCPS